jgi:hypothetical protein
VIIAVGFDLQFDWSRLHKKLFGELIAGQKTTFFSTAKKTERASLPVSARPSEIRP